jgi:hypothetical protein
MFYQILKFALVVVFATIAFMVGTSESMPLINESNSIAVVVGFVLLAGEIALYAAFLHYMYHRMFRVLPNPPTTPKE